MAKLGTFPITWISIEAEFTTSREAIQFSNTTAVFWQSSIRKEIYIYISEQIGRREVRRYLR